MEFQGKVVLVTGGASGIGFVTCRRFAEAGAFVLLTDVDAGKGAQAGAELRSWGGLVQFRALDLTDLAAAETAAAQIRTDPGRRIRSLARACGGRAQAGSWRNMLCTRSLSKINALIQSRAVSR
jgi:NAD(P)-dependent dehydrogenase (short-subunit alcohol dehydrogenase family)